MIRFLVKILVSFFFLFSNNDNTIAKNACQVLQTLILRYFPLIGFCGITFVIRFVRALSGVFYTIVSSTSSFFVSV